MYEYETMKVGSRYLKTEETAMKASLLLLCSHDEFYGESEVKNNIHNEMVRIYNMP